MRWCNNEAEGVRGRIASAKRARAHRSLRCHEADARRHNPQYAHRPVPTSKHGTCSDCNWVGGVHPVIPCNSAGMRNGTKKAFGETRRPAHVPTIPSLTGALPREPGPVCSVARRGRTLPAPTSCRAWLPTSPLSQRPARRSKPSGLYQCPPTPSAALREGAVRRPIPAKLRPRSQDVVSRRPAS